MIQGQADQTAMFLRTCRVSYRGFLVTSLKFNHAGGKDG